MFSHEKSPKWFPRYHRLLYMVIGIVAAILLVTGCQPTASPTTVDTPDVPQATSTEGEAEPVTTGSIVIALRSEPRNFDVSLVQDAMNHPVAINVYEGLTKRDPQENLVSLLAKEWSRTDDLTWRFKLQEGVSFHNGEPFNAEAAVFSINRALDPELNSEMLGFYGNMTEARAVDNNTIEIITSAPDPIVPSRLVYLMMVPPKYVQEMTSEFEISPVGTGPYKFVEWVPGQQIKLTRNDEYWGTKPQVKDVTFRAIEEAGVRLQALVAGEVDIARNLAPEQAPQAPKVVSSPGVEVCMFRLNTRQGIFQNESIRQAANYAIDRDSLIEDLFQGYAVSANGQIIALASFGYNPDLGDYPYDPDKAKELLEAAGYNGEEIILVGQSGRWVKDRELLEAVTFQLQQVGINAKPEIREWQLYLNGIFEQDPAAQPDAILICPSDDTLTGDRVLQSYAYTGGRQSSYSNPEVDQMIDQSLEEFDDEKRTQQHFAIWERLKEEAAFVSLAAVENIWGLSEKVLWTPRPDDFLYLDEISLTP